MAVRGPTATNLYHADIMHTQEEYAVDHAFKVVSLSLYLCVH